MRKVLGEDYCGKCIKGRGHVMEVVTTVCLRGDVYREREGIYISM